MLQMPSTSIAPTIEADGAFDRLSTYIGRPLKLEGLTFNSQGGGDRDTFYVRAAELAAVYAVEGPGNSLLLDFKTSADSKRIRIDPADFVSQRFQVSVLTDGAWKIIHARRNTENA